MDGGCWFENVSFCLSYVFNKVLRLLINADAFVEFFRWVDHLGNVHGRVEGLNAGAQALLIGSHLVMLLFLTLFS